MYKTRLGEPMDGCKLQRGYTETDPSGRYGRFRDILGKGAMKTVYRAFDEVLGMEVAWNQVKLNDVFRSPEELQRLYSEVHLLKSLNHDAIMRFYASWIDVDRRTFNFITEMFTSGTLREYRQRYNRVNIRAIKNWARQILKGLACLHSHDPPVIHRDLKCDNIFVNGHLGQVKIGDLGLAAILRGSQHAHSVIGTPEFMAPELYEENYNELVDIYSFGMCVLEMLSCEYPYSECSNPAQIYKKVTSGKLPEAFFRMEDAEAQKFVRKCLENASKRPSASELLEDPFLIDDEELHIPMVPNHKSISSVKDQTMQDDSTRSTGMKITGTLNPEDDTIFLKIQISDKNGGARNIYFPFDTMNDTALDVATEMVRELEITDWESFEIAEMIDEEISALVPTWKEWEAPKNHHHHHQYHYQDQHSFKYDDDGEDDDDERIHNPFYSLSSHSSSQSSLSPLLPTLDSSFCGVNGVTNLGHEHDWLQEDLLINDDDASSLSSSINSYKYSNLYYCSRNESDFDLCTQTKELNVNGTSNAQTCTRVYPEQSIINKNCNKEGACNTSYKGMTKIRSLVDMRSQLLHRSLVEQINKRRLFKTVGAVENIGYHEPVGFSFFASDKLSMGSTGGSWRCARDR